MQLVPLIIHHRRNKIKELLNTPRRYGVEIDVRSNNNKIILNHDPFKKGVELNKWVKKFNHKFLIVNTKEEGLEKYIKNILERNNIKNFFFLDQSFPFLIKTLNENEKRCAVRFSEYEDINTTFNLSNKINWVWVDYFSKFPLDKRISHTLKKKKIKICIISPELSKKTSIKEIKKFINFIINKKIHIDAVCTKNPEIWKM